jgi:hypothetical protein
MKVKVKTTGEIIDVHFSHDYNRSGSNEKVYSDSFTGKYYYASELEQLTESMQPKFDQFWAGQISAFKGILKILDTIEVKESENERIREALIALLKFGLEDGSAIAPGFNETKEQALAWLEKQNKHKPKTNPCEKCNHVMLNCHNFPCIKKQAFDQNKTIFDIINKEK